MLFKHTISSSRLVAETRGSVVFISAVPQSDTSSVATTDDTNPLVLSMVSPDPYPWSAGMAEVYSVSMPSLTATPWAVTVLDDSTNSAAAFNPNQTAGDSGDAISKASFSRRGIELPHETEE